jgi:hypothetical protein
MSRPKNAAMRQVGATVRGEGRKDSVGSRADRRAWARQHAPREARKDGLSGACRPPEVAPEPPVTAPTDDAERVQAMQAGLARLNAGAAAEWIEFTDDGAGGSG